MFKNLLDHDYLGLIKKFSFLKYKQENKKVLILVKLIVFVIKKIKKVI